MVDTYENEEITYLICVLTKKYKWTVSVFYLTSSNASQKKLHNLLSGMSKDSSQFAYNIILLSKIQMS